MTSKLAGGLVAALLVGALGAAHAAELCPFPYLNATNIRPACEQYGANGLSGLYKSNRFINRLLTTRLKGDARAH
jgi:hypothetical protein